jgi:catechol 2,3-dioxygenase-like lactoylglutathione lyase family enzyme
MADPTLSGFHHATLNVHDVERSEQWYQQVLGFVRIASYEGDAFARVIMVHRGSGTVLGLNRHRDPVAAEPFREQRAGLDHLAFQVADREALDLWAARFEEYDVPHSEVKPGAMPGAFLVTFRDPDNIQLEIFATATP